MSNTNRGDEVFYTVGRINITVRRVMDLVVGALNGGSNYWYYIIDFRFPSDGKKIPDGDWGHIESCVWGNGYIQICDKQEYFNSESAAQKWLLNESALKKGVELLVTKEFIHHFANFVQEKEDANTADIFLQLCLFGKIVYG